MDIIAHSLSGILLGQIAMKEDTGAERKYYFSVCIAGLILPDIDAISYLFDFSWLDFVLGSWILADGFFSF